MVGVHQALAATDDAVPIRIVLTCKRDIEEILQAHYPGHCVYRRWLHPNLSVPVYGHESEGRIDGMIDHLEVEGVTIPDCVPISNAGAAQRIDTDPHLAFPDSLHV